MYFGAHDGNPNNYNSFWKTDGTNKGTIKLKDVNPAFYSSQTFCISGDLLYFNAIDFGASPFHGSELWKTNGTPAGTKMVKDINPLYDANPTYLTDVEGTLFFAADDGHHGFELWSSKGDESNTIMVKDITPAGGYSDISLFTAAGGRLFFVKDRYFGGPLWSSGGDSASTEPVTDETLETIRRIYHIAGVKNQLFLSGDTYKYGIELFVSHIKEKNKDRNSIIVKSNPEEVKYPVPFNILLSPNPTKNAATLNTIGDVNRLIINVHDMSGKLVWRKSFNNAIRINLPVEKWRPGIYNISANNGKEVKTIKLVKE